MNKVGLFITLNKYKNCFQSRTETKLCNSLDEAKHELIDILANEYKYLQIDFPDDLQDFEHIIFDEIYVNANAFTYKIFENNNFIEPWDSNEIYEEVLDELLENEQKLITNNDELKEQDEIMESNYDEEMFGYNDLKELQEKAKNFEKEVEDCDCNKCKN